jgi:Endonuclease NucS
VRDFKVKLRPERESMGTASPFNVKSESLVLRNFTRDEVAELYGQHTAETGQVFEPAALDLAFESTQGQPWLVNALARQMTEKDVPDRGVPITAAQVDAARETLILRRDTHLDSLVDKLHEERVRRVIEPILAGTPVMMDVYNDDLVYVRDLGLVVDRPNVRIANPIYQEIIPRSLTYVMQAYIANEATWYTLPDGSLDMRALLRAFQQFFAENSDAWLERYDYKEAGPHLVLQAFLQRVINGGGRIRREFAVGSGRVDLLIEWKSFRYAIELKIRRGEKTEAQGVEQLGRYLSRMQLDEGYLVIFDRRREVDWDQKLHEKEVAGLGGRKIIVFGA